MLLEDASLLKRECILFFMYIPIQAQHFLDLDFFFNRYSRYLSYFLCISLTLFENLYL